MYLAEKEGKETLEIPGEGFVTYKITGEVCHVCILYTKPEVRRRLVSRDLIKALEMKVEGRCHAFTAVCATKQNNTTDTLKVLLFYGFKVINADAGDILLYKELR